MLLLLVGGFAFVHGQTVTVGFPEPAYQIPLGQEFQAPVRMHPMPQYGLFSYGLIVTVEGSNGLIGITTLTPKLLLDFDGINGSGSRGITAASGRFTSKGTANMFPSDKPNHTEADLGTVNIADLPDGNYTLRLAPYNTLGPTESVFVDGQCRSLDQQLAFGTATLIVTSNSGGTITALGPMTPDRQTGLLIQEYEVRNTGRTAAVFRILISNMPAGSEVWNVHGTIGGIPYVDLAQSLAPGATQKITLEYRSQDRTTVPKPEFELTSATPATISPDGLAAGLQPRATLSAGNVLLEFNSTVGKSYYIQYTANLAASWTTVLPKIEGTGNRIQWIDNGPPKTDAHPSAASIRLYRILVTEPAQ